VLCEVATTRPKNISCYELFTKKALDLDLYFVRPKQGKLQNIKR
jgi:hypothetical protein